MKHYVKFFMTKTLDVLGLFPTRMTTPEDLRSLLLMLHPISPNISLIRLGPQGDGGYLVPDDLSGIKACFSPGVCFTSGFEKKCADLGLEVFLADRSVSRPSEEHELFHFSHKFIGAVTNENFVTIDDWVDESLSERDSDLIL